MTHCETIFFDVGNTLLFPKREITLGPLHQQGIFPGSDQLRALEGQIKRRFDGLKSGGKADHGFWHMFYSQLLGDLGIEDDALRDVLVRTIRTSGNWCEIRPGTREVLLGLGNRYRLGVISNADGKIAEVLEKCGIADCFETITDSGLVGEEKPLPAIFQAALRSMGAVAKSSLYVGDVYSVDYVGATSVGMEAVLFDVCGAYRGAEWPRVESLEELQSRLESQHDPQLRR
jgi:FMN phosphatase YigB (HAD superfamily)